jgi:hypothetical protein
VSLPAVFVVAGSPACQGRPAGSGLATAARQEPGLPRPPPETRTSLRPAPPWPACLPPALAGWPAQLARCGAGRKQRGQGRAGRWPVATWPGTELRQVAACNTAPALPRASLSQSERSHFLASLTPPEKRAAGAAGISSERSRRLTRPQASSSDRRGSGEKWPLSFSDLLIFKKKTLIHAAQDPSPTWILELNEAPV